MKDIEMVAVIFGLLIVVGAVSMGFKQGQANPDADHFFESRSSANRQK